MQLHITLTWSISFPGSLTIFAFPASRALAKLKAKQFLSQTQEHNTIMPQKNRRNKLDEKYSKAH